MPDITPVELFSDKFIVAAGVLALDVNTLVVSENVIAWLSASVAATVMFTELFFAKLPPPSCPAAVVQLGALPPVTSTSDPAISRPPSGLVTFIA